MKLTHFPIRAFRKQLLTWYEKHKRSLPWRESKDPYRIWVSEIMLQQTQVETVKPYFEQFMEQFPTPEALAEAEEDEVMKAWEGLGYYSRARHLHSAVKEVMHTYGGEVPKDPEDFASLKGVGPYTKGAVMSIAHDREEPAVDGNVMRVLARVLLIEADVGKQSTRRQIEADVRELMAGTPPAEFNQALMELGALVCTPKNPDCPNCPLKQMCRAYNHEMVDALPIKAKKKTQKQQTLAAAVVENEDGDILVEQRPKQGLLAGLWQFPMVEALPASQRTALKDYLEDVHHVEAEPAETGQTFAHVFTHLIWHIHVYRVHVRSRTPTRAGRWLTRTEAAQLAFPVSHQKIWQQQL
ncbi:A/G-specific adenine glycosylase [Natribacillus halophilus]|uniref:Adenine DNA glycosylase n=1 Tax=Natribacillus halophilus TaxID=549003 RepID=A0A1G8R581_9BACI|nr:A/G-specific adenine glycosylase [Natribacillus halophilus]SDJ11993.1 A/G-specific DNA-adenine glycosylase [Natribacillus halophilus]